MIFKRMMRVLAAVVAVGLAGCARGDGTAGGAKAGAAAEVKTVADYFPLTVGGKATRVQFAVTPAEMQRGLMGRAFIGADEGMVFLYEKPQRMSFWMRNTPSPLDIGFFRADGTLGEVYPLYPYDETTVASAGEDYTLALEMNQGWFAKNGVKPGAKLDLKEVAAALRARGVKPEKFGVSGE